MPFVCILASGPNGSVYAGVSNDLIKQVDEHTDSIMSAIQREQPLSNCQRNGK